MATIYKSYNLPGFGLMRVGMFPYVKKVYEFLEGYGHISRLREVHQLGGLRDVFPGAHHTRYEYVMAQLAIITELCHLKGHLPADITLSANINRFGRLPGIDKDPSCGDVLMILVLLTNIGHFPSTFSGERAFVSQIKKNNNLKRTFRSGLPKELKPEFDQFLDNSNTYRANLFLTAFLLERYRRKEEGNQVVDFCQSILRAYLKSEGGGGDQQVENLKNLFRSIRRLTFLALDSLYTPVPFSLDLASIFISLEHFLTEVFIPQSSFQEALSRLEGVMRDTVYLSPYSVLKHAQITSDCCSAIESHEEKFLSVTGLRSVLGPTDDNDEIFGLDCHLNDPKDVYEKVILLAYQCDPKLANRVLSNPVNWEMSVRRRIGLRSCMFGAEWDPPKEHLKVAAGLLKGLDNRELKNVSLKVAKQLCDFDIVTNAQVVASPRARWRNGCALIIFLLETLLDGDRKVRLKALPMAEHSPVFIDNGSTRVATQVDVYYEWAKASNLIDKDGLNEIKMLRESLRAIDYRGTLIAFAGATEVINQGRIVAEFDSVVLLVSRTLDTSPLMIVEAKNMPSGHTMATAQLTQRLGDLGVPQGHFQINRLGTKGAYGLISF